MSIGKTDIRDLSLEIRQDTIKAYMETAGTEGVLFLSNETKGIVVNDPIAQKLVRSHKLKTYYNFLIGSYPDSRLFLIASGKIEVCKFVEGTIKTLIKEANHGF